MRFFFVFFFLQMPVRGVYVITDSGKTTVQLICCRMCLMLSFCYLKCVDQCSEVVTSIILHLLFTYPHRCIEKKLSLLIHFSDLNF